MKVLYRILFLLICFSGALFYFGSNMQEKALSIERKTIPMQEATLPVVTVRTVGEEINLLHGYCSNLDGMLLRESITPLTQEKNFEILISENDYTIKKVIFDVYETSEGNKIETNDNERNIILLDKQIQEKDGKEYEVKVAKIKLKEDYTLGEEYVVKLTLISTESKRIYYYTRIKIYENSHLHEKLDFISMFHNSLLDKEKARNVSRYIETKKNADESDFSTANIYNSLDFLSYGQMAPSVLYEELPVITEYTQDMASAVLGFYVQVNTPAGLETYYVKEYYRFRYTPARVYLFNYERHMEEIFDAAYTSLVKSEFKFGITADTKLEMLSNNNNSRIAFVRNGTLYVYTDSDNVLTTAFTFRQKDTDYIRDMYDKHGIKLLSIDDAGAVDFLVYGYMNRGEYEGRVGMVLYTYHPSDQSVEERSYFPINTTYEILKETMGSFFYCSRQDIFYFHIYNTIYSYNLTTKNLEIIAENVTEERLVYSKERQMIAWQSETEIGQTQAVHIMDLDTGKRTAIETKEGNILGLLGIIDVNLILGTAAKEDIEIREDGTRLAAYASVDIVDFEGSSLKNYQKDGYYITAVEVEDNVIRLQRVSRTVSGSRKYETATEDYILKQAAQTASAVKLSARVTDLMKTEHYLSLPESIVMNTVPATAATQNAVITKDVTVRINTPDYFNNYYITYAYGNIMLLSKNPGMAIALADTLTGSVIGSSGKVIWSRGAKAASADLKGVSSAVPAGNNSLMTCVKLLLAYRNVEADVAGYQPEQAQLTDWLGQYIKANIMKLTGVTLDEALYYVYKKNPIIAVNESGTAILVTGYDSTGITAVVPQQGRARRMTMKEAEKFLEGENCYFLVIE